MSWSPAELERMRQRLNERVGVSTDDYTVEQALAHRKYGKALRDGTLTRPDVCERCGEPPYVAKRPRRWPYEDPPERPKALHGHHHRGYSEEHALDVIFLCPRCHGAAHAWMNITAALRST